MQVHWLGVRRKNPDVIFRSLAEGMAECEENAEKITAELASNGRLLKRNLTLYLAPQERICDARKLRFGPTTPPTLNPANICWYFRSA